MMDSLVLMVRRAQTVRKVRRELTVVLLPKVFRVHRAQTVRRVFRV